MVWPRGAVLVALFCLHGAVASAADAPAAPGTAPPPAPACVPDTELQLAATMLRRAEGTIRVYVGQNTCDVDDPTGIDAIKSEYNALQTAFDHTTCARQSNDPTVRDQGVRAYEDVRSLSHKLTLAGVHMVLQQALLDAQKALADAQKAKNVDDAKAAAKVAATRAKTARDQLAIESDPCARDKVAAVEKVADLAQQQVDLRDSGPNSMCGADDLGRPKKTCGVYGISAASLSYLWAFDGNGVRSGRRLASVGIPSGGFRIAFADWLAMDIGGYSAFITKSLASTSPSVDKIACSKNPTDYENRLPCEATNEMYAYFGAYLGFTMGRKGVGFVTLTPVTAGIAQLGTRTTLVPYFGLSVGVLQLNGSF